MSTHQENLRKFGNLSDEQQERLLRIHAFLNDPAPDPQPTLPEYMDVLDKIKPRFVLSPRLGIDELTYDFSAGAREVDRENLPSEAHALQLAAITQEINVAAYVNMDQDKVLRADCYVIGLKAGNGLNAEPHSKFMGFLSSSPRFHTFEDCQRALDILLNIDPEWVSKRFML